MLEAAHANVNQLDRESGSSFRDDYWTDGVEKQMNYDAAQNAIETIAELDKPCGSLGSCSRSTP